MQHRMKEFSLSDEQIGRLLKTSLCGRLGTVNEDGYPYVVAVHFVYHEGCIYVHGLNRGQKISNIKRNPKVCFEIDEMQGLLTEGLENPCKADTAYESVVVLGDAVLMEDMDLKREVLEALTRKYVPEMAGAEMPLEKIRATAVIEITMRRTTGKYHK